MVNSLVVGGRRDIVCPKCDSSRYAVALIGDLVKHLKLTCTNCNMSMRFKVGKENKVE